MASVRILALGLLILNISVKDTSSLQVLINNNEEPKEHTATMTLQPLQLQNVNQVNEQNIPQKLISSGIVQTINENFPFKITQVKLQPLVLGQSGISGTSNPLKNNLKSTVISPVTTHQASSISNYGSNNVVLQKILQFPNSKEANGNQFTHLNGSPLSTTIVNTPQILHVPYSQYAQNVPYQVPLVVANNKINLKQEPTTNSHSSAPQNFQGTLTPSFNPQQIIYLENNEKPAPSNKQSLLHQLWEQQMTHLAPKYYPVASSVYQNNPLLSESPKLKTSSLRLLLPLLFNMLKENSNCGCRTNCNCNGNSFEDNPFYSYSTDHYSQTPDEDQDEFLYPGTFKERSKQKSRKIKDEDRDIVEEIIWTIDE